MINGMSAQDALIAIMILMSAADNEMSEDEVKQISNTLDLVPAFNNFDRDRIGRVSESVVEILQADDGLATIIGLIKSALPERLWETAYALACDVAAADGQLFDEEIRLLEIIRHEFRLERLIAAGIERGSRARHMTIE